MSEFQFNSEQRHFPIYGVAHRSSPVRVPINYRLWIVELIYVYPLGKEMILDEFKEQKTFRTSYRQWVAAKEEQALVTFHEAGFFQDLYWIKIIHNMVNEKPVDGWFQYDYVLDLAEGTEKQYMIFG